jgi:hypothetical protein
LFVSYLLWKAGLPRTADVPKEVIALGIVFVTLGTMVVRDRIPQIMILILSVTLIWGALALFEGQGIGATLWGWFRFFKYLFVGLLVYQIEDWPPDFAQWLLKFCVGLLAFEVVVQLIQFSSGVPPGDSLAGTFGWKGVSELTMLVFFVVCLGFGHWLATGKWTGLLTTIVLGLLASMLDVTKLYIPAVAALAIGALLIHVIRGGRFQLLLTSIVLLSLTIAIAVPLFNAYAARTRGLKPLQEYLTPESIRAYMFNDGAGGEDGQYNLGSGLSLLYGWQTLSRDKTTLLFGYGLGSRTASAALGIAGKSLEQDLYGGASGTGWLSFMQEFGLLGIGLFLSFNTWVALTLLRDAKANPDHYLVAIQYGLVLFTLFWPVWLWYTKPWVTGMMMILYWSSLGYVFRQIWQRSGRPLSAAARLEPHAYEVVPISPSANSTSAHPTHQTFYQTPPRAIARGAIQRCEAPPEKEIIAPDPFISIPNSPSGFS